MHRIAFTFGLVCLAFATTPSTTSAQYIPGQPYPAPNGRVNQQRGATLGGIAGAVAGGLIGDNNGEAGAGAAIGGVLGAVTGGILGNAADKETTYQRQQNAVARQQNAYAQQQQVAVVNQSAVSIGDVVSMSRSGLSDSVIINQIQTRGVLTQPQVADIISLHQQGVSETVITTMQTAPTGPQRVARAAPQTTYIAPAPASVIIEERVVLPYYEPPRRHYYHRSYPRTRSGFHIRF